MDEIFKKHFQKFLERWGEDPGKIDFDKVTDFDSLWEQIGIEDDLVFKPSELFPGLKFLF